MKSGMITTPAFWQRWFVRGIGCVVLIYLGVLAVQVALRVAFPWDLFTWAESPFMTDMLKLDSGHPIYEDPADGNSFVYSPGLTYLTWAVLKPLGLHLDIRFCRVVIVVIGVLAGMVAGAGVRQALRMIAPQLRLPHLGWLSAGLAVLVIFRNFNADATHPDNLVMFHTAGLLWLTLKAVQSRSFGWAVAVMIFSALGVFAKQTLCVAFIGPALVFLRLKPWELRTRVALVVIGVVASGVALAALWYPEFARFYTWEVLTRQKIYVSRFYWMLVDLLHSDRALLLVLGAAAIPILWRSDKAGRRYLEIWAWLGLFSVTPGALAYAKIYGTWNNIIIYQLWLLLLVLPALSVWLGRLNAAKLELHAPFNFVLATVVTGFVLMLLPTRYPADRTMYDCCAAVQSRVTLDLKAGRRVLVAYGTMYQLRAGSREIPLDRACSIGDLRAAGISSRVKLVERVRAHYYDRLYLAVEEWYDDDMRRAIHEHYLIDEVIPRPDCHDRLEVGRSLSLIGECKIMSPRPTVAAELTWPPKSNPQ